jgi:hypothetical protein
MLATLAHEPISFESNLSLLVAGVAIGVDPSYFQAVFFTDPERGRIDRLLPRFEDVLDGGFELSAYFSFSLIFLLVMQARITRIKESVY